MSKNNQSFHGPFSFWNPFPPYLFFISWNSGADLFVIDQEKLSKAKAEFKVWGHQGVMAYKEKL